jgi:hypothetical protein
MHSGAIQEHRRHTRLVADCEYVENQSGALQIAGPGLGAMSLKLGGPPIRGACGRRLVCHARGGSVTGEGCKILDAHNPDGGMADGSRQVCCLLQTGM